MGRYVNVEFRRSVGRVIGISIGIRLGSYVGTKVESVDDREFGL